MVTGVKCKKQVGGLYQAVIRGNNIENLQIAKTIANLSPRLPEKFYNKKTASRAFDALKGSLQHQKGMI